MQSALGFNPDDLPKRCLTMTLLVALESPGLRKLLKTGLRRGMTETQLGTLIDELWQLDLASPEVVQLLNALQCRGWLTCVAATGLWKTHLGSSTTL